MPTLHVRSVPDDLYDGVRQLAQSRGRSLSAQVVSMLERALKDEERQREQAAVLARVYRRRFKPGARIANTVSLLREDRQR